MTALAVAPAKADRANSDRSSIGLGTRRSMRRKTASSAIDEARRPRVAGEDHPQAWPWFSPSRSASRPAKKVAAPAQSNPCSMRSGASERIEQGFDWAGAATFFAGLLALLLGLNQGHAWGWSSPATLGLLASSIALLAVFLRIERRVPRPMLDLSLFARSAFAGATASAVINYVCVYGILFLVPFYLIEGRGLGPARAGLLLTAQPLVMMFVAPLAGTISDRIGTRIPAMVGMAMLALGL